MKIIIIYALFLLTSQAAVSSTEWESEILKNVTNANEAGCDKYPRLQNYDNLFICEELLINVTNSLYKGWSKSSDKDYRVDQINIWWLESGNSFDNPLVKLHLAALIGQTKSIDVDVQRDYTRAFLSSKNKLIQGAALTAIGWLGNDQDVVCLLDIISREEVGIAEKAVLALIKISGAKEAKNLIRNMPKPVKRDSLRDFINTQMSHFV